MEKKFNLYVFEKMEILFNCSRSAFKWSKELKEYKKLRKNQQMLGKRKFKHILKLIR